jgi:flavin reductase (DIM6/NTAB) family NADH-FMN oxidoreductase RutF
LLETTAVATTAARFLTQFLNEAGMSSDAICNADIFRKAMRLLAGGVTLITTADGDERAGLTATAVCSLSVEPPRVLACVNLKGATYRVLAASRAMTVNLLGAAHEPLAHCFGGMRTEYEDPFALAQWSVGVNGAPTLVDAVAAFECSIEEMMITRTHAVVIGEVRNVVVAGEARPLIYVNGTFGHLHAVN